jgi:tetratricopeptide (TPR) repeat protein
VTLERLICLFGIVSACCAGQSTAEKLIESGHWKRARTLVEARIREAPDDPLANFLLSQIRNAFGDRTTPLPLAEKALALDGKTAKYHRQVAEVQGVMAQHANAFQQLFLARRFRKEIDAALALDPRDLQAWRDLLEYYLLAPGIAGGDSKKAAATAERIVEIDAAEGFLARARVAGFHKRTAEVEGFLRKATEAMPPSYRARIALAQFYLAGHRRLNEAEVQAKDAIKLARGRVDAYTVLAQIYAERSAWDELESVLADAAREVPDDLVPYYRAAESLIAAGRDPERAGRYLRIYVGQEPEGNEPSAADAARQLKRLRETAPGSNSPRLF